jgi:hypothetical protein
LLGGARSPLVVAADSVVSTQRFAATLLALRPDVTCVGPGMQLGHSPFGWPSLPGHSFGAEAAMLPVVEGWLRGFDERARRRSGVAPRYGIDELATFGLHPIDPEAPLPVAWTGPGRHATLLLPGWATTRANGSAARLVLHLLGARIPLDDAHLRLRLDGRDLACRFGADRIEATIGPPMPAAFHRLDIGHAVLGADHAGIGLTSVAFEPA